MPESDSPHAGATQVPLTVVLVVAAVLVLRLIHLSSSVVSPLTYQLGPDEEYYFRFARAGLSGHADTPEFEFMDPLYGYLVAAVFRVAGPSVFAVFALQCVLDAATAVALLLIGRELGKPRAGLMAAGLYGLTSTALMFSCSLLKEVWVCAFVTWWVLFALRLTRTARLWTWLVFGLYCGMGVPLRSTILLLAAAGLLLPLLAVDRSNLRLWAARAGLLAIGATLALAPWIARNLQADHSFSPLPTNAGVVLHQAYNADNPASTIWIPPFVHYLNPSEIWRGYAAEAERRAGRPLAPREINEFWKQEALQYIEAHPLHIAGIIGAKALKFFAATDTPINRSLNEEALFSPVVRYLPPAAPFLISLGLVGLALFARADRRWLIVAAPVALSFVIFAVFWAEDRFRFHAFGILALGGGLLVDYVVEAIKRGQRSRAALTAVVPALLLVGSVALGRAVPATPMHWDQVIWGYIKMHNLSEASKVADRVVSEQPQNGAVWEAVGYIAVLRQNFEGAEVAYRHAVDLRPQSDLAHFNLAKVLQRLNRPDEALDEAGRALALRNDPDYQQLAQSLKKAN